MPPSDQPSSPGRVRRVVRRLLRIAMAALLLAVGLLVYLHQVGLPEFFRERLTRELAAHGIQLHYERIGLRWYRGIVAEQVRLGSTAFADGPRVSLPEVAFRLHAPSLLRLRPVIKSLELRDGRLEFPLHSDLEPMQVLTFENAGAELRFMADGAWRLDRLVAECLGFQVQVQGRLDHAVAFRELRSVPTADARPWPWELTLHRLLGQMKRLEFEQAPRLNIVFQADATRLEETRATVRLDAGRARSPWGSIESLQGALQLREWSETADRAGFDLQLESQGIKSPWLQLGGLRVTSQGTQSFTRAVPENLDLKVVLVNITSPWGALSNLNLTGQGRPHAEQPHWMHLELALDGGALAGAGGESDDNQLSLRWVHDLEQAVPRQGEWQLQVQSPRFDWGRAERFTLQGQFARAPTPKAPLFDPQRSGWDLLDPWKWECTGAFDHLAISNAILDRVAFDAAWEAPTLTLRSLEADLFQRQLRAGFSGQPRERTLTGGLAFDFDVRQLGHLLPPGVHRWLEPYSWSSDQPPQVRAQLWLTLPPWGRWEQPEAWAAAQDNLGVQGSLVAAASAYRGVPMDNVTFDFQFTNSVWRLTDFVATAPQGRLGMSYSEDQRTGNYRFDLDANLDPRVFRPVVPQPAQRAFDYFDFGTPPAVTGYVVGCWRRSGQTGFGGLVQMAPFRFRGEPVESFEARLEGTNDVVRGTGVRLHSEGSITADEVEFDLAQQRLILHRAHSTVPPMRVARAIGDEVVRTLTPYQFDTPPRARVEGWLNVRDTREVNLSFEVDGGPFHYWRFQVPQIQAVVNWVDQTVRIDPLEARFYEGQLTGRLDIDLAAAAGADFGFHARVDSVDFKLLMADLLSPTNQLQGHLHGSWTVTHANSEDWTSWNGLGQAELKDGYLWDLSILGGLSDLMNRLKIDVGRNPIRGLTADFTMTNSLIHTRNLELQSAAMRLDYRGTFDFQGGVNARVEARLLHDTALIGPIVSLLFSPLTKMLEFRVTGTLADPNLEPLYLPKPLLFPLNPISTLRELLQRPSFPGPEP